VEPSGNYVFVAGYKNSALDPNGIYSFLARFSISSGNVGWYFYDS
jgi:hypothetical protein